MAPTILFNIDFSRQLTANERRAFAYRQGRLDGPFGESVKKAAQRFISAFGVSGEFANRGLRVRSTFSCLLDPIGEDEVSDRSAPARALRPPATRIMTSRGAALRLYLVALACNQVRGRAGSGAVVELPLTGGTDYPGWDDLIATGAEYSGSGRTAARVRDKKARSLRTALNTLREANLIEMSGTAVSNRYAGFTLLDESGSRTSVDPVRYKVPKNTDDFFTIPVGFVTNGWINVLEDSEIAAVCMLACGKGGLNVAEDVEPGEVAIPADARLRSYGIHRDAFSTARKNLEWFGLVEVREVDRHEDGRAEGDTRYLHRFRLIPEGFNQDGLEVVRQVISEQLARP